MYIKVTFSIFRDHFQAIRPDHFSYHGLKALFDYLDESESELDVIEICGDFSETTISDFIAENDFEHENLTPSQLKTAIENYISENSIFVDWIDADTFVYANF